jgi:recombination protein RecA
MARAKIEDSLADLISANLNKLFKDTDKVAYIGEEETPVDLMEFVSTGSSLLDLAIANRPYAGIPFGRITELTGLEGSGKSLVAAHIMANTQKMGGVAVLIDTEAAVNWEFFKAVGLDRSKNFVYAQIETVEDIFEAVTNIIESVRKSSKDKPVTIVIDSMAGASTKMEMASDFERQGFATGKAVILSTAMRKVTTMLARQKVALVITNQLRHKMNAPAFSDPWTTSGGRAVPFHSSVRLRFTQTGTIKRKEDDMIIGVSVKAKIMKNRVGPPLRTVDFDIYFDRGIDDVSTWFDFLKKQEVLKSAGAYLKYTAEDGTEYNLMKKDFRAELETNKKLREELYLKMADIMKMHYKTEELSEEDIEVEDSVSEE